MIYTTLRLCRDNQACKSGYDALVASLPEGHGDDDPISLLHILEKSRGFGDAIWAFRAATDQPEAERVERLFACDCAEHVLHLFEEKLSEDTRPRLAIETARRFANGEATRQELAAAWDAAVSAAYAAWDAARTAAWNAAGAAAGAATWNAAWNAARNAAEAAARSAARSAEIEWQAMRLREALSGAYDHVVQAEVSE